MSAQFISVSTQPLPSSSPPTISQTPLQPNSQEDYKDQHIPPQSDEEHQHQHHLPSPPSSSSSSSSSPSSPHMNRRTRSQAQVNGHSQEKHENGNSAGMNEVEHRRKYPLGADDEDSATQATRLMNREEFSLDNDPLDSMHSKDEGAVGFLELPKKDQRAFVLLVMLYFLQVIYIAPRRRETNAKHRAKERNKKLTTRTATSRAYQWV